MPLIIKVWYSEVHNVVFKYKNIMWFWKQQLFPVNYINLQVLHNSNLGTNRLGTNRFNGEWAPTQSIYTSCLATNRRNLKFKPGEYICGIYAIMFPSEVGGDQKQRIQWNVEIRSFVTWIETYSMSAHCAHRQLSANDNLLCSVARLVNLPSISQTIHCIELLPFYT